MDEDIFEDAVSSDVTDVVTPAITPDDPKWHDFVMGMFDKKDLVKIEGKDYPNVGGLRRVAKLLLGTIVSSRPVEVWPFDGTRATVSYLIKIITHAGEMIECGDVADVSEDNQDPNFMAFPVATAATRAEARCLRKILGLAMPAAEEMNRGSGAVKSAGPTVPELIEKTHIQPGQLKFIDSKCRQLNIDADKFLNGGKKKFKTKEEIPFETAQDMIQQIGLYINGTEVPKKFLGYKENWSE